MQKPRRHDKVLEDGVGGQYERIIPKLSKEAEDVYLSASQGL